MPGFIVNTNLSEEPDDHPSQTYMLTEGVALVTGGEPWFQQLEAIRESDIVFLYANNVGIIARGIAIGEPFTPPERFCGERARCMKLRKCERLSRPITFSQSWTEHGIRLPVRWAVNKIDEEKTQKIWDIASGRL